MTEKLPEGWIRASLAEVCLPVETIQPGDTPAAEFTYFDIGGIDNERNRIAETKTVTGGNAPSRARQSLRKGDILFSTVRTYLRKIARVDRDYPNPVASTGFVVIRPVEGVSSQFLFFQLLSEDFLQPLHELQTGSSYPAVRARDVFAQTILLPPAYEQNRIAAKLSAAFSGLERAEAAALRAQEKLRHYHAAVLDAAATGQLTRAWRESQIKKGKIDSEDGGGFLHRLLAARRATWEGAELKRLRDAGKNPKDDTWKSGYPEPREPITQGLPELPQGWTWASIDQLSWDSGYGTSAKCSYTSSGAPVLRIPNIRNRMLDFDDLKFASSSHKLSDDQFIAPGDLLLVRTNGSKSLIGRAAVVKTDLMKKYGFASYLIRFRLLGNQGFWSWLAFAWDSGLVRIHIEAAAKTTSGQYNVSLSGLGATAIPLPPVLEQAECVGELDRRLSAADQLATTLGLQLQRSLATRQTLLREAFTGRLVSQEPSDEPASLILERVRAQREAETQNPKGKRMAKPKSKTKPVGRQDLLEVLRETGRPMTPEELFKESGHSQESVDQFFAELRQLTTIPAKIVEERSAEATTLLKVVP